MKMSIPFYKDHPKKMRLFCLAILSLFLSSCQNSQDPASITPVPDKAPLTKAVVEQDFKIASSGELAEINKLIEEKKIKMPEEIVKVHRPKSKVSEGNYSYNITRKIDDKLRIELTLIEDGLMDDSQKSRKSVYTMNMKNNALVVIALKEQYRCRKNRGQEDWGAELCL